ncbi:MAG: exodeoxyribonuclease III [Candidatus Magasanikbacteria bacterium]
MSKTATIVSWNVNGIRATLRKGFADFLDIKKPDILGLQEVKIHDAGRAKENFDFKLYEEFWNSAERPGYAGTAIFIKHSFLKKYPVLSVKNGVGKKEFDSEGRVQTLEFKDFYLVNTYFPHTRHDLSRLPFKLEFNKKVWGLVKKLEKKKPVILMGDLNVAHTETDLANPKANIQNPGFLPEERESFDLFLKKNMIDTFRTLHPEKIQYSWWSWRFNARARNVGWRIDYVVTSKKLKKRIEKAFIWDKVEGSDHCPVGVKMTI